MAAVRNHQEVMQTDLRDLEDYLRDIRRFLPVPVACLTPAGVVVDANAELLRLLGVRDDALVGATMEPFLDDEGEMDRIILETIEEGAVRNREALIAPDDERRVPVLISTLARRDERGECIGLFASFFDVTEQRRTEAALAEQQAHLEEQVEARTEELREANRRLQLEVAERRVVEEELRQALARLERTNADLDRFVYVASHDLQEPLRTVSAFAQLLVQRYTDDPDEDVQELLGYITGGIKQMTAMILGVLEYSRLGSREIALEPTDSAAAAARAVEALEARIANSDAEVVCGPLPTVTAAPALLTRLFQNLIGNAVKFRGERPLRVQVRAERQEDRWLFSVQDNGLGFEPGQSENIFQVFSRLHRKDEYPGTGIGLAICKGIVTRHHGEIWADSEAGRGATFYFTIPCDA